MPTSIGREHSRRHPTALLAGAALAAVTLLAAACGSGAKLASSTAGTKPSSATTATTPAVAAPAPRPAPEVLAASSPRYGTILTTARGFALYTYTADDPGGRGCTGTCLQYWPPLLLPAGVTVPVGGPGVSGLGTFARGTDLQITWKGLPLYTFVLDKQPGQVTGQGDVDSGGTWNLAILASPPRSASPSTTKAPATPAPAPSASTRTPDSMVTQPPTTHAPVTAPPATRPPTTMPRVITPPTVARTTPPTTPPTTAPPGGPTY